MIHVTKYFIPKKNTFWSRRKKCAEDMTLYHTKQTNEYFTGDIIYEWRTLFIIILPTSYRFWKGSVLMSLIRVLRQFKRISDKMLKEKLKVWLIAINQYALNIKYILILIHLDARAVWKFFWMNYTYSITQHLYKFICLLYNDRGEISRLLRYVKMKNSLSVNELFFDSMV